MSLMSDCPFSSVTTYRKDFTKKDVPRLPLFQFERDFNDPIAGPHEQHILPKFQFQKLPESQTRYPEPGAYAEYLADNYPSTRMYLKYCPGGPPDLDVIDQLYQDENRSIYMVSYCLRGDYESKHKKNTYTEPLPEGWEISETTHKRSYMNPCLFTTKSLSRRQKSVLKDNLSPNAKERELLDVKTGETVYIAEISNTGDEIIRGKLHGDINIRPKFNQDDLLRAKLIRRE